MNNLLKLWTRRYKLYASILLCTALLACSTLLAPLVRTQPEQALSADSFVDTIGTNVHLHYTNSVYFQKFSEIIEPKLKELGVRHVRDAAVKTTLSAYYDRINQLGREGIKFNLIIGPKFDAARMNAFILKVASGIESVEGPNEYDNNGGRDWVSKLRAFMQLLFETVKANTTFPKLLVLGPTWIKRENAAKLGDLSHYIDFCATHPYPGGQKPTKALTTGLTSRLRIVCGSKPLIVTETGYHNAVNKTSKWDQPGVSELAASKYLTRLFLENFNFGIKRTYQYELINVFSDTNASSSEENYGLLRNDGSEKPAYVSLKNLISLLKDPGASFSPESLDYTLSGNTTNVHKTFLQKRDGRFYLILWLEVASYDLGTKKDITVPNQQVTLTLNTPISKAITYLPNTSTKAIVRYSHPKRLTLKVPDHPLVIELTP